MPIVDIPDVGTVEFPDEMSHAEIAAAAKGIYEKHSPNRVYANNLAEDAAIRRRERELAGTEEDPQAGMIYEAPARVARGAATGVGDAVRGAARAMDMVDPSHPNEAQFFAEKLAGVNTEAFPLGVDANTQLLTLADVPAETLAQWRAEYQQRYGSQEERLSRSITANIGKQIADDAREVYVTDPTRDEEFKSKVLEAGGTTLPVIAASAIPGVGIPLAGAQYGLSQAEQAAQEAQAMGGSETQAEVAFLGNMAVGGLSEALIGVGPQLWRILRKVREAGVEPKTFGKVVLKAATEGFLRESAQEGLEQLAQNVIASKVAGYDPERPAMQGVVESALVGGTVGALMGGGGAMVGGVGNGETSNVQRPTSNVQREAEPDVDLNSNPDLGPQYLPESDLTKEPVTLSPEQEAIVLRGLGVEPKGETSNVQRPTSNVPREQGPLTLPAGPATSVEQARAALRNTVLPDNFTLPSQENVQRPTSNAELPTGDKAKGTLRKDAQEFDRLMLEYGMQEGWVTDPEVVYDERLTDRTKPGKSIIRARIMRDAAMKSARRKVAIQLTGDAEADVSNVRSKAALLPKLRDYVAQKYEQPAKQREAFQRATVPRKGKEQVATDSLVVGDKLKLAGEEITVSAVNPDTGEVTLDDGKKFGRQVMPEGSVFYVEAVRETGEQGWEPEGENVQRPTSNAERPKGSKGAQGQKANAYPGGPLGEPAPAGPVNVEDDAEYSALPLEFPELVRLGRDLMGGAYPKLKERINLLKGKALGLFRGDRKTGETSIELRRDLFDLLTKSEKDALKAQAEEYAQAVAENPEEAAEIAKERYEYLLEQAYAEAKKSNPLVASKVLAHEIGHLVDFLPQHMIQGRGNLLARIASLKDFLKWTLPSEPGGTGKPLTPNERAKLKRDAEKQLKDELGPIREIIETIIIEEPEYRIVGVTAEDVKQLLGMDARETMPELYLWFAQQDAAVKKEILKAAMKGVVDLRAAGATIKEQTGSRKVEKTVRKVSGRLPTKAEIQQRFQELLRKEMEKRRLLDLQELKAELEPLIAWWRGTAVMEDYFKPSAEMYAEAFSVFLNNPAAMEKRAPKYFKALLAYMENKPEVAQLYQEIQNSIKSGTIMRERVEALRNSWEADSRASMEMAERRWTKTAMNWLDNVLYHIDRRFGPVYRLARKAEKMGNTSLNAQVRDAIGSFLYRASEHELFLGRMNREVGQKLTAQNLDWTDLGEFMFHQHIIHNRFNLANPMGWTSKTSLDRLTEMKEQLGPLAWQALGEAQANFRSLYEQHVAELLKTSGLTNEKLQQAIEERVFYATFAAVKGREVAGIDALLDESFGNGTGAAIYQQVGNLGDIKNPATATVFKALSLISAAYRNKAKASVVKLLQETEPTMIRPADRRWTGKRLETITRETDKVGTLIVMEDGKAKGYYVPKLIAEGFNRGNSVQNLLRLAAVRASGFLKGLYTQFNYAFWPVNFVRDTFGWIMQMPQAGPVNYAKVFVPAMKAARDSLKAKRANPNAELALKRKMLISRSDPRGLAGIEDEYEARLASFGFDPAQWDKQAREVSAVLKLWNSYKEFGQAFERVNKIAAMMHLDRTQPNMPEWQKREIVRERGGSPDFLQRGATAHYVDLLMMFFNPWKEGIRSMAKAAKENPLSFTGKLASLVILPTVLQALGSLGFFGDDWEELMASVPDYDVSNYLIIPLGWANKEQQQVAYLRLPLWEPARLMHGLVWTALTGRGQTAINRIGGQVPSGNALWSVAGTWLQYEIQGRNPYDSFMGREILDPSVFEAGGWRARQDLAKWTWNQMGGGLIHRFRDKRLYDAPEGEVQEFLNLPVVNNALGRWVKVSSRGKDDADKRLTEKLRQERAAARVAVREIADKILSNPAPLALTEAEKKVLADSYAMDYLMNILPAAAKSRAHPLLRRLDKAGSKEEKRMILENEAGANR